MSLSMSQASAPTFTRMLTNLSTILDKAQAWCDARKIDPTVLTASRLSPDMFPMGRQVQIACDTAKGAVARLAGVEIPKHEDTEKTFAELKARIAKTLEFIATVKPAQLDGTEAKEVVLKLGPEEVKFTGQGYLLTFALPNFFFHVTTAYAILRHNGVDVGKRDYLGPRG